MGLMPPANIKREPVNNDSMGCGTPTTLKSEEKTTNDQGREHARRRIVTKRALPVCIENDAHVKREMQEDKPPVKSEVATEVLKYEDTKQEPVEVTRRDFPEEVGNGFKDEANDDDPRSNSRQIQA